MLVVTSLFMAMLFVGMALVLSASVHVGVMATAPTDNDAMQASEAHEDARQAVQHGRRAVNTKHPDSHDSLARNLSASLDATERALADQYVARGAEYAMDPPTTTNRTVVRHDDADRNFSDATGAPDWTLATTVTEAETFDLALRRDSLSDTESDRFEIRVHNATTTWVAVVGSDSDSDNITAEITSPTGSTTCTVDAETARIDLVNGTLAGTSCPRADFQAHLDGPYRVSYANADNVTGEYQVDLTTTEGVSTTSYGPAGTAPRATFSIATVTVRYSYRTTTVHHAANVTAP